MNKFGKAVLAAVLAASLAVTPVFAAPDVEGIRQSKEASENALESLKNDLAKTIENINELEGQLIETGEKIAQAEVDLAAAQEKEDEQYEAMKLRIRYMYEEGNTSFLTGLLESKSISEVLNKAEYIQNVHQYDRQKLQEEQLRRQLTNLLLIIIAIATMITDQRIRQIAMFHQGTVMSQVVIHHREEAVIQALHRRL